MPTKCNSCHEDADSDCKLKGKLYCRTCAHNLTHSRSLEEGQFACPVIDGESGELTPFGTYSNIDWT